MKGFLKIMKKYTKETKIWYNYIQMEARKRMKKTIQEIADLLQVPVYGNVDTTKYIHGVEFDSRNVQEGNLFVPIIGARVDGHSFIDSVIEKKAMASLWQKDHMPYPEGIALFLVEDTVQALQTLAKRYLQSLHCKVVAVTGSNGKTSCKDMIYSICSQEKRTQKTQGNRNSEIGLPLTVLDFNEDIEVAVLEMGMENKGEIETLCQIAQPDISIITTIGSAHMENLGGKKQIAEAKCEILDGLKEDGLFFYNKDCPEIEEVLKEKAEVPTRKIVSFGTTGDIQITSAIQYKEDSIVFDTNILSKPVTLHALGDFQAMNSLPAIAAAKALGIQEDSILTGLKTMQITKMRTQLISIGKAKILDDSYKSNPESAMAAIDTLMALPASMHIAVLSDMLDLGPEENQLHASIGTYAFEKGVDRLYCVGPLSKYTEAACQAESAWFETKEELLQALQEYKEKDCVILVKGSRAMAMDEIVAQLQTGGK